MALTNKALDMDIETVCFFTSLERAYLTFIIVKEVAVANGDVSGMVPAHVQQALEIRFSQ